ncbi:MAG: hypothetical protein ACRDZW_10790, partial [Acidimicrobiales bacterium]
SLANDQRGHLGSDTGGKAATLAAMAERGGLDPDLGYWAERWDPDGRVHPLLFISHLGDRWVDATTMPMLVAAYPLYRIGGYRLALLLPMVGAVLAALAARALARRLGGGGGWTAFWVIGLASPVAVYALDLWEHTFGVAAMAWGVVFLVDLVQGRRGWPAALAGGLAFGAAATMRTEALVYAAVAVAATGVVLLARRRVVLALASGVLAAVGLVVPIVLNTALEVATVGQTIRSGRAAGTVAVAGVEGGLRLREAAVTALGFLPSSDPVSWLLGLILLVLLGFSLRRLAGPGDPGPAVLALVAATALYLLRLAGGPGYVPGLIPAAPLAVLGLVLGWRVPAARQVLAIGLAALPLVWATEFVGGGVPQWGGRYVLTSGLLFANVGCVALPSLRPWAGRVVVGLAVVVTGLGLTFLSVRSHGFGRAGAELAGSPEPVLVSRVVQLAREGGVTSSHHRWLTAATLADQRVAVDVVRRAGFTRFGLVTPEGEAVPAVDGWHAVAHRRVPITLGAALRVTTFEPAPAQRGVVAGR